MKKRNLDTSVAECQKAEGLVKTQCTLAVDKNLRCCVNAKQVRRPEQVTRSTSLHNQQP